MENIVKVDIEQEVLRLAGMDGVKHPAELNIKVELTKRQRYKDAVVQYYKGRDDGYAEGVKDATVHSDRLRRVFFLCGVLTGALLVFGIHYAFYLCK